MVHAIEAFTSARLKNPLSDHLAVQALQLLSSNLVEVCLAGANIPLARGHAAGCHAGGAGLCQRAVAAVPPSPILLGGVFHLPRAEQRAGAAACAALQRRSRRAHYAALADALLPGTSGDHRTKTAAFITHIRALITATQMPAACVTTASSKADLPRLAADAINTRRACW